jgi:hypothetical protein
MIKVKYEAILRSRETKEYCLLINGKEVMVEKSWYEDDISNEYEIDWDIVSVSDSNGKDIELTEEEDDEIQAFMNTIE